MRTLLRGCSDIPASMLPEVRSCSEVYGYDGPRRGAGARSAASRATSRRRSSARRCFEKGDVKNTYGTGNFILMNTGETPV